MGEQPLGWMTPPCCRDVCALADFLRLAFDGVLFGNGGDALGLSGKDELAMSSNRGSREVLPSHAGLKTGCITALNWLSVSS
jgi:hypothetical protein